MNTARLKGRGVKSRETVVNTARLKGRGGGKKSRDRCEYCPA